MRMIFISETAHKVGAMHATTKNTMHCTDCISELPGCRGGLEYF